MFLCGDYVQTDIDLATMEGANESGRAAVNALLEASGSSAEPVPMYKLYDPPEFEALKAVDAQLYAQGLPERTRRPGPLGRHAGDRRCSRRGRALRGFEHRGGARPPGAPGGDARQSFVSC